MKNFIEENKNIIIISVIILGFLFYWFQLRPISIKKNCSLVTEVIKADAGITKEQAIANKKELDRRITGIYSSGELSSFGRIQLLRNSIERPPQPERKETNEATKKEYDSCLRQHGL